MSSSYAPPPTGLSGALRNLKPDFPDEGQPTMVYSTEAHAPTHSTGFLRSSQLQLQADGQRGVAADVVDLSAPEETDLRAVVHSTNHLNGHDNRVLVEPYGGAGGSISDLVHQRNSGYGLTDQYGNGEGPRISGFNQRNRSTIASSTDDTKFDPLATRNSLTGSNLKNAYNQFKQYESDDEDLDRVL